MTMPIYQDLATPILDMIKENITIQALNLKHSSIAIKDDAGCNALYYAIETKNSDNSKLLIEKGIPLMVSKNQHALFHAVYCNDIESVKLLIAKGIDIDIRDCEFKTPLMCAVYYNRIEIFKYLINNGADMFKMDLKHDMAIDYAYAGGTESFLIQDILHWRMMHAE